MEETEGLEDLLKAGHHGHIMEPPGLFTQLRCPIINKEYIQEHLKLPDQFMGAMTLKEGTFVTITTLQSIVLGFIIYWTLYLTVWQDDGKEFWIEKFRDDFDPLLQGDEPDLIKALWKPWYTVTTVTVIVHGIYFIVGLGVCIGLCYNHCNPFVYIPWLLMTAFMVTACFIVGFIMFIYLFIQKRSLNVTFDVVPMILVFLYAGCWTYGFRIVLAHYKRRRIVQFWRKNKRKEFFDGN